MKAYSLLLVLLTALTSFAQSDGPPPPLGEDKLTFSQIEKRKDRLKDKVVRLEIATLLGKGTDWGNGLMRYIAKDTSGGATPYGQVAFPKEGLERLGLVEKPDKGPFTVYVRIRVFGGKAAALSEVVGSKFTADGEKGGSYSW